MPDRPDFRGRLDTSGGELAFAAAVPGTAALAIRNRAPLGFGCNVLIVCEPDVTNEQLAEILDHCTEQARSLAES